jgi:Lon protease-like protein
VLEGINRARLKSERPLRNGYRVFDADWIPDVQPPTGNMLEVELARELRHIALSLLQGQEQQLTGLLHGDLRLSTLTDMMVGYLPFRPEFKLEQLAEANVLQRAARCVAELEQMLGGAPERPVKPDDPASMN